MTALTSEAPLCKGSWPRSGLRGCKIPYPDKISGENLLLTVGLQPLRHASHDTSPCTGEARVASPQIFVKNLIFACTLLSASPIPGQVFHMIVIFSFISASSAAVYVTLRAMPFENTPKLFQRVCAMGIICFHPLSMIPALRTAFRNEHLLSPNAQNIQSSNPSIIPSIENSVSIVFSAPIS